MSRRVTNIPRLSLGGQPFSMRESKQNENRKSTSFVSQFGNENVPPNNIGRLSIGRNSIGVSRPSLTNRTNCFVDRGPLKDPRNHSDKEYRKDSVTKLINYLTENGYDQPISHKLLSSPSMKDCLRIFQFLYNELDPGQKFTSPNIAEEIPILMKEIGYPFTINKSALLAWTPRTWPSLLGCLTWLVELCVYFKVSGSACYYPKSSNILEDDDDYEYIQKNVNRSFFEYLSKAYVSYLDGEDDYENGTEIEMFAEKNNTLKHELDEINSQIEIEIKTLNELQSQTSRVSTLKATKEDFIRDKRKFQNIIEGYNQHMVQFIKKEVEIADALKEKVSELQDAIKEKMALQQFLSSQELSQTDVEKMNNDRIELRNTYENVIRIKEQAQKLNWEREKLIKQAWGCLDEQLHLYHQKAEMLGLIPVTAKNANGVNFGLQLNFDDPDPQNMLSVELKGNIKPELCRLKETLTGNVVQLKEELCILKDHLEQVYECISDKKSELKVYEDKMEKLKNSFKLKKETFSGFEKEIQNEVDFLEENVQNLRSFVSDGKLDRLKADFEHEMNQCKLRFEETGNEVFSLVDVASTHKEYISHRLSHLKKVTTEMLQGITDRVRQENWIK